MKNILSLLICFLFSPIALQAQTYTPVGRDLPLTPSFYFPEDGNADYSTMVSNGYGQWPSRMAVPLEGQSHFEWVLFGDTLTTPSLAQANRPVPSGVIAHGPFIGEPPPHNMVKVATNLFGSVRYVWADVESQGWRVQGFSDGQTTPTNLDIKFTNLAQKNSGLAPIC